MKQLTQSLNSIFGVGRTPAPVALANERQRLQAARRRAHQLALKHGIKVERDQQGGWWVTDPTITDERADPLDGGHFASNGGELLGKVEAYLEHRSSNKAPGAAESQQASPSFKIPPAGTTPRFGDISARHLYEVYTGGGWSVMVDANNRDQAARIAEREGYTVSSVNMVG